MPDGEYSLSAVLPVRPLMGAVNYSGVVREYGYPLGLNGFHGFGNVRPPCHGEGAWVNFSPRPPGRITRGQHDGFN
jgi:hypothetical protein